MTKIYFARHAEPNYSNHDNLTRELSAKGLRDRSLVTEFLRDKDIYSVYSSPYKRAKDTVGEFAEEKGLGIVEIDDFRERTVDSSWIDDFTSFCKAQWSDFDFKLPGGESLRETQERNIAALNKVLETCEGKNVVIGSHGTAIASVVNHYEPSFGYEGFESIRKVMPCIAELWFEGKECRGIKLINLFTNETIFEK